MSSVLEASGLVKDYVGGDGRPIHVLTGVDLTVASGEFVAIVGASGSGKSTLLHLLGALDEPGAGAVALEGRPYGALSRIERAELRNRKIGFVFQFHHLLREFSALENVMMPLLIRGEPEHTARARALTLLEEVDLADRATHRPGQLSGGEQQRVAVARALVAEPRVVLADEPSGNLDPSNAAILHDLLERVARPAGRAMVAVTHNRSLAGRADRILALHDGRLSAPRGIEVMAP